MLFVEPDPTFRLAAIEVLRDRFEPLVPGAKADPVKEARRFSPDLVVLAVNRQRPEIALRAARVLVSTEDPPAVGQTNLRGARIDGPAMVRSGQINGYLSGRPTPEAFLAWVEALYQRESPVVQIASGGRLERLLRRVRER
jgi:hypothetical protein